MRSNPSQDDKLRQRLQEAVDRFASGSADLFGRKLGYANGGYIRELLKGPKPVRGAVIERTHAAEGMEGWFDAVLLPLAAVDLAAARAPAAGAFEDATLLQRFARLRPGQRGVVEHAMRKALDEMEALEALRGQRASGQRDVSVSLPRTGT